MKLNKNILFIISIVILLHSCIEEYAPTIEYKETNKYVVFGVITDQEDYQEIRVSKTSSVVNPIEIPLGGCNVKLIDDRGNSIIFNEYKSGFYRSWISQDFLNIGTSYQIDVTTPLGDHLVSDFEEIKECPDIDSVYFIREDIPTNNPEVNILGIQFYLNLNAENVNTKHFKFDVEETWEYHTDYPLEWYYDGTLNHVFPPDYSNNVCWKTENVKNIFILNTSDLEFNKFNKLPLHYVNNKTSRLAYMYSILIKQYSISEKCFTFWEQLQSNNLNDVGLYETQPLQVYGNIHNLTNPDNKVLGYFQVSSIKTKRIFVSSIENLELKYDTYCSAYPILMGFKEYGPDDYPVYVAFINKVMNEINEECVMCKSLRGTNVKPDYWP